MSEENIIILDFGGQYSQLIARRIRECNVYCEIYSYNTPLNKIKSKNPKGIIFTGSPDNVYAVESPKCSKQIYELGIPILGICYGMQLIAYHFGSNVKTAPTGEYGKTSVYINNKSFLFKDTANEIICWMSHTDYVEKLPKNFKQTAYTYACPIAAMENTEKKIYALQFHPEIIHTVEGKKIISSFVKNICGCNCNWQMESFTENKISTLKSEIKDGKVLCALSGGVDSSVAAVLLSTAIGKQLTCIFVDHGLLRKNEADEIEKIFGNNGCYNLNFVKVNAQDRFYKKLEGITEPEQKRKIIGEEFIRVFEDEAKKIGNIDFLVQGTIYPDVIESGLGKSAVIKSHHNVGGLPQHINFKKIIEPLRMLFKDEVRKVGLELGIPENLVYRQPFPGPGLGIRITGEVTLQKIKILQEADAILREEIVSAGLDKKISQYFAVLTDMRSVGVMGDSRTYDFAIVLRAVQTSDFMTAEPFHLPWNLLQKIMTRIVNEVKFVNRVLYDCTGKPPATIEFE